MRGFLKPLVQAPEVAVLQIVDEDEGQLHDDNFQSLSSILPNLAIDWEFTVYASDIEDEDEDIKEEETEEEPKLEVPQRKHWKMLEIPAQEVLQIAHESQAAEIKKGLDDLEKHIKSQKNNIWSWW